MPKRVSVIKSTGEMQDFSEEKLYQSLQNSGASEEMIESIISEIRKDLYEGIPTRRIYQKAFRLLRRQMNALAARYSLKKAIMELGPTGYPFENFVGKLMSRMGYEVQVGQIVKGRCVSHEVDVVAWNGSHKIMVECKYHNAPGKVSSVQVPLYIQSRFLDVKSKWEETERKHKYQYEGWVVTNTRFSTDAEDYGRCAGLRLIGWDYPRKGSLKQLVQQAGVFPVTAITSLNTKQKQQLIERGIVLCSDVLRDPASLNFLQMKDKTAEKTVAEAKTLVELATANSNVR
ncbi:MAG TPA: restriction endonuclease [Lentimicrobium sp.]|jgi:hypothetical protein|nr:restriction endonuclease [Lentimicrobium sp.]